MLRAHRRGQECRQSPQVSTPTFPREGHVGDPSSIQSTSERLRHGPCWPRSWVGSAGSADLEHSSKCVLLRLIWRYGPRGSYGPADESVGQLAGSDVLPARPLASSNMSHCATSASMWNNLCMESLDGLKLKPDSGHPRGRSSSNWFRIVGDKIKPDSGHPDGRSSSNWYRLT